MRPDLRLLLPAAACWVAAAVAPGIRPAAALDAAVALVGLAACALRSRHAAVGVVVVLLAAAAGLASSGVRQLARAQGPLAALAAQGADVVARVPLTGDPVARSGVGAPRRAYHLVIVPMAVTRVEADVGRAWSLREPLLVLASTTTGSAGCPASA